MKGMEGAGVSSVVSEAVKPQRKPADRIRLLSAIVEIGRPLDPEDSYIVMGAAHRFGPGVAEYLARVIANNRTALLKHPVRRYSGDTMA